MKRRVFRLFALLCLAVPAVLLTSVSALAASGGESVGFLDKWVGPVYDWFEGVLSPVFAYIGGLVYLFTASPAAWLKYVIFLGVLAVALVIAVVLLVSLFKRRFFRALARAVILAVAVWVASFAVYFVKFYQISVDSGITPKISQLFHVTVATTMGKLYDLLASLADPIWLLPAVFVAAWVLVIVLMAAVISCSKKRERRRKAEGADSIEESAPVELAAAPLPSEETVSEQMPDEQVIAEESAETEPAEACAVLDEISAPAEEQDEVSEEPCEPSLDQEPVAEPDEAVEEAVDQAVDEAADQAQSADEPACPLLPQPVFMPVPSAVFDTVDFTDPDRDGFTLCACTSAEEAAALMSDALAEELTAIVYRSESGATAQVGLDCLNANFKPYAYIDVKILRRLGLVSPDARRLSVVARGAVDKPLMIEASEISPDAVKMITLAGGRAIRVL